MKNHIGISLAALATAGLVGPALMETKEDDGGKKAGASPELKEAINKVGTTFEEYKQANDARIAEIEKNGKASPETEAKMAKMDEALTKQQEIIDDLELRAKQPAVSVDAKGKVLTPEQKEHADAFNKFMREGDEKGLGELQMKALSVGSDPDGGYAVPEVIDSNVLALASDISPIRSIANVVSTSTSDYKKLVNKHGAGATWQGETGTAADSATPQLEEINPPHGFLEARPRATQQMLDDGMFNVEQWLADEVALAFAISEGAAFINGNGTNKPRGFLAGPAPVATNDASRAFGTLQFVASGAATALPTDADPYIDLVYQLKAAHRGMARWVTSREVLATMRKMKDTDGQYLWQPGLAAGQPSSFLGFGITEAEDMPAVAADAFPVAFGNFKAGYTITDRFGVRVLRDPFTAKPYVEFYTTKRVGGAVVDSEAIKLLKVSA